ncbi:MAG TPA: DAK2 domain-containing protein [Solirubrobacteraceae bacterium]|nr:DAK2 domain-containing protein [Solirubrobacteraceae bacterium]
MSGLDAAGARRWAEAFLDAAERDAEALGDLDRKAGDGDFGTNLVTSVRASRARLGDGPLALPADAFSALSAAFMATGGTSGPLFGMWYRELARAAGDGPEIATDGLAAGLAAGLAVVRRLGGAEVGDKTMVDAMAPAAEAVAAAAESGADVVAALTAAARAARAGAEETASLVARRGRASYVGEVARGIVDPGAATLALFLESGAAAVADPNPVGEHRRSED